MTDEMFLHEETFGTSQTRPDVQSLARQTISEQPVSDMLAGPLEDIDQPSIPTDDSDSWIISEGTFQHSPLTDPKNEIRLFELEAGKDNDEIRCKLHVCNRATLPKYQAISYTWGDGSGTQHVRIDNMEMSVAENCWTALQQVRRSNQAVMVWIDAISINQDDSNEKGHQVQQMARVYENASSVSVSLGMDAHDAEFLFDWVDELFYSSEHPEPRSHEKHPGQIWDDLESFRKGEHPARRGIGQARDWVLNWFDKIGPEDFKRFEVALTQLGRHPYWQRMWVQPELAFAREAFLFYGPHICRISVMKTVFFALDGFGAEKARMSTRYSVAETAQSVNTLVSLPMKATLDKLSTGHIKQPREHFGGFRFQELSKLQCSEPCDRVFAILPLVDWDGFGVPMIAVDYTRSPFSLAQECIAFCADFWEIKYLLESLQVGCEHTDLGLSSFLNLRANLPLIPTARSSNTRICECGVERSTNSMYLYSFCYCRIPKDSLEEVSDCYKIIKNNSKTSQSEDILAYVPKITMPGDILLSVPIGKSGSGCEGLIIRGDHRGVYEFVGQAVIKKEYVAIHYSHYPAGYEFRLSQQDAMAFAVQGSTCPNCSPKSTRGDLDMDKGLIDRLRTPFTSSRYSSYAIEYHDKTNPLDKWKDDYVEYQEVNKTRKIICTNCGDYVDVASVTGNSSPFNGPFNVHRALLNFKPSKDDELELEYGQLVRIITEHEEGSNTGWALCMRMDGSQQGLCPRTFLSEQSVVKPRESVMQDDRRIPLLPDICNGPPQVVVELLDHESVQTNAEEPRQQEKHQQTTPLLRQLVCTKQANDAETKDDMNSSSPGADATGRHTVDSEHVSLDLPESSKEDKKTVVETSNQSRSQPNLAVSAPDKLDHPLDTPVKLKAGPGRKLTVVSNPSHLRSSSAGTIDVSRNVGLSPNDANLGDLSSNGQLGRPRSRSLFESNSETSARDRSAPQTSPSQPFTTRSRALSVSTTPSWLPNPSLDGTNVHRGHRGARVLAAYDPNQRTGTNGHTATRRRIHAPGLRELKLDNIRDRIRRLEV